MTRSTSAVAGTRLPEAISYEMVENFPDNAVDWVVDPDRAVLLVHDMQHYFVRRYDRGTDPMKTVIANIGRIREVATAAGCPIVFTAQPGNQPPEIRALLGDFWGPGLSESTADTEVIAELAPERADITLPKWRYSAFARTDLSARLAAAGRDQVIVTGVYAHIGVLATALDGFMRDVRMFVVADAVADFSRSDHEQALEYVAARCGSVVGTADVVEQLSSGDRWAR